MPEGHAISRRSAAAGRALTRQLTEQDGETYGEHLEDCTAAASRVVRVKRTTARLLAPRQQQPKQQVQPEAAGGAGERGGSADDLRDEAASPPTPFW